MPELPEVETIVRGLRRQILDREALALRVFDLRLGVEACAVVFPLRICKVERFGKCIEIFLGGVGAVQYRLVIHLRMTGALLWCDGELDNSVDIKPLPHERFRLVCRGGYLSFVDVRRFGTLDVISGQMQDQKQVRGKLATDPLDSSFTIAKLRILLNSSRQAIKPWLLRQDMVVGIGNIYASEILFAAALSPVRIASTLDIVEVRHLRRSIRVILKKAIQRGGTTISDYRDSSGKTGNNQKFLQVYGREGLPCNRCKGTVARLVQASRSTYYCPECQV